MTEQMWTVGQIADQVGVSVRTLHHYDQIGLVIPSERSLAGYRLYTAADVERLQHVVVYRRLGFPLDQIAELLDATGDDLLGHLRRQREVVTDRVAELHQLVAAIDRALEGAMTGYQISREEQRELFGDSFTDNFDDYQAEAEERWGDTDAWKQSQRRTANYSKEAWQQIKDEMDAINADYVELMRTGVPPEAEVAMDVAEAARQHICRWFYDCPPQMHANIAQMYISDPRFERTYEEIAEGLSRFVHDAVVANACRQ